jgi:hypothetical protein
MCDETGTPQRDSVIVELADAVELATHIIKAAVGLNPNPFGRTA